MSPNVLLQFLIWPSTVENDCLQPSGFICIRHLLRLLILCWFHHFSHHQASRFKPPYVTLYWILILTKRDQLNINLSPQVRKQSSAFIVWLQFNSERLKGAFIHVECVSCPIMCVVGVKQKSAWSGGFEIDCSMKRFCFNTKTTSFTLCQLFQMCCSSMYLWFYDLTAIIWYEFVIQHL